MVIIDTLLANGMLDRLFRANTYYQNWGDITGGSIFIKKQKAKQYSFNHKKKATPCNQKKVKANSPNNKHFQSAMKYSKWRMMRLLPCQVSINGLLLIKMSANRVLSGYARKNNRCAFVGEW